MYIALTCSSTTSCFLSVSILLYESLVSCHKKHFEISQLVSRPIWSVFAIAETAWSQRMIRLKSKGRNKLILLLSHQGSYSVSHAYTGSCGTGWLFIILALPYTQRYSFKCVGPN